MFINGILSYVLLVSFCMNMRHWVPGVVSGFRCSERKFISFHHMVL